MIGRSTKGEKKLIMNTHSIWSLLGVGFEAMLTIKSIILTNSAEAATSIPGKFNNAKKKMRKLCWG